MLRRCFLDVFFFLPDWFYRLNGCLDFFNGLLLPLKGCSDFLTDCFCHFNGCSDFLTDCFGRFNGCSDFFNGLLLPF